MSYCRCGKMLVGAEGVVEIAFNSTEGRRGTEIKEIKELYESRQHCVVVCTLRLCL